MKKVPIFEVLVDEKLRFASISEEEARDHAQLIWDNEHILADIQDYSYVPVDHTQAKKSSKPVKQVRDDKDFEETYERQ